MICEPQFMQVRQISNIVFRNMVAQSYISNYFIGPNCNNSMLIREFCSGSRAHFAYIGGDASRIRGVSGISLLVCDESLCGNTEVITIDSTGKLKVVPIKDIKEKDFVLSFDFSANPRILISVVKKNASYHGKRACFKVTTETGRQIICTADHPFPTDKGAKRLSEIIEDEYLRRTSKTRRNYSITTECHNGISIGGRIYNTELQTSSLHKMESWWKARRLCKSQVHPITRAYYKTTRDKTESRLRRYLVLLGNEESWDISLITSDVVSKWIREKESDRRISFTYNTSCSSSLALDGRWLQSKKSECWDTTHKWLLERGCGNSSEMVYKSMGNRNEYYGGYPLIYKEALLGAYLPNERFYKTCYSDSSLCYRINDVQSINSNKNMPDLWKDIPQQSLSLLFGGVQQEVQEELRSYILSGEYREAQGISESLQRNAQRNNSCSEEGVEQKHDSGTKSKEEQKGERLHEGTYGRSRSSRTYKGYEKSQKSTIEGRSGVRSQAERGAKKILREDQSRSREICGVLQEEKREERESCVEKELTIGRESSYSYDRIVSVEYIGEEDVYDIEVEGTHNFILANGTCSFNCDDMELDVINIAAETMSAVREGGSYLFTGTPKLTDGTLPYYFNNSSGGEITIKCEHCNKYNIATIEQDLLKMIGNTTCICAKCGKPLDVRKSFYTFRRPELRASFDGFHLSQVTHPLHCTSIAKWRELLNKRATYPEAQFYNEILGEPNDLAVRLISRVDIESATTKQPNNLELALSHKGYYGQRILGVDWGGYGLEGESFTVMAILGLRPMEQQLEVLYLEKIPTGKTHAEQVGRAIYLAEMFECAAIAHDGTGAGAIKEEMLNQEIGSHILTVPLVYMWSPRQDILRYIEPNQGHAGYYTLDKTRSLALTIGAIKAKQLLLPTYKSCSDLLDDFLALGEDIRSTQNSGDIRIITRMGTHPDDTAHAINLAANALWHMNKCRPDLGSMVEKYDNQPDWVSEGKNKVF